MPATAAAAKRGDWEVLPDGTARVGESILSPDEFDMRVVPLHPATTRPLPGYVGVVVLDTDVTDELALEGRGRDLVREIQDRRRQSGFSVSDRIVLEVAGGPAVKAVLAAHSDWIAEQVLAVDVSYLEEKSGGGGWHDVVLADGTEVAVRVTRR
jgi:isoleucyl-tRNA synthetase